MSHPINDEILEKLYEQYEIYARPSEDNVGIHEYYVIKDENNELVQHKDKILKGAYCIICIQSEMSKVRCSG